MLMNVNDAVVMDGTIIRPGSDGEMKIFKSGHLYINDASVKGATGSDVAEVRVLQLKNGWAADPFGGALDAEMMALVGNAPVDLNLLGAVVNPLGKVSVVNTLGSINVTGTISALSLDIQAKGNFSLQSDGWFNTGADPTVLENSWKFIVDYFKNNAASTGASETASDVLLKWGYQPRFLLLLHRQRQGGQRFAHLRAGRGEHIGPDAEHRRQDPERGHGRLYPHRFVLPGRQEQVVAGQQWLREQRRVVQRRRIHESLWRDHGPLRLRHADHHPGSDPAGGRQHR